MDRTKVIVSVASSRNTQYIYYIHIIYTDIRNENQVNYKSWWRYSTTSELLKKLKRKEKREMNRRKEQLVWSAYR